MNECIDIVHGVFQKAAIRCKSIGTVAFIYIAVVFPIVEARGVHPFATTFATATAGMDFNSNPIANSEFINTRAQFHNGSHVLMAWREILIKRQPALNHCGRTAVNNLDIGCADGDRINTHQDLGRTWRGHGLLDERQLVGVTQDPGLHFFRDFEAFLLKRFFNNGVHEAVSLGRICSSQQQIRHVLACCFSF